VIAAQRAQLRRGRGYAGVGTPAGGSLLWFADWRHALGTTPAAQQDGVSPTWKLDFRGGATNTVEVIESTGLGFPTPRCLKVPFTPAAFNLVRTTQLPVLAIGVRRTFRWYYRCDMPVSDARMAEPFPPGPAGDWNYHPIQDGFAGSNCNWAFETNTNYGTDYLPWFFLGNGSNVPDGYQRWFMPLLPKYEVCRFEWQIYRDSATTFTADCDVFNAAGTQIADSTSFVDSTTSPTRNLVTVRGSVPGHGNFPFNNVANTNGLNLGTNDTYTVSGGSVIVQCHQAGVAVADDIPGRLIGPYPHFQEAA
jgi:hypothetical protein